MKEPDVFVDAILTAPDLPALKDALKAGLNRSFHVYLGQKRDATREPMRTAWAERRNAASWEWARRRRELQDAFAARLAELEGRGRA